MKLSIIRAAMRKRALEKEAARATQGAGKATPLAIRRQVKYCRLQLTTDVSEAAREGTIVASMEASADERAALEEAIELKGLDDLEELWNWNVHPPHLRTITSMKAMPHLL